MQRYDAMYIIRPNVDDEAKKALVAEIGKVLTDRGASNLEVKEWGMHKLAYEIDDFKDGYYVDMEFDLENTEALNEYTRVCNIKDTIIRSIVVKIPSKK